MSERVKEFTTQDWERIELYMKAGATADRVAESFRIDFKTFNQRFIDRYGQDCISVNKSFRIAGQLLIEATQFQKALAGSNTLLIWLGKILCGQRDTDYAPVQAPKQAEIDAENLNMRLQHHNALLKELLEQHGIKSETE